MEKIILHILDYFLLYFIPYSFCSMCWLDNTAMAIFKFDYFIPYCFFVARSLIGMAMVIVPLQIGIGYVNF
jgi:hypothetical protein